ncbi:MAG: type II toxin-antitoxin system RelE/ParE family toxin [Lunatimonas sp.]|uniref:type II toxin-antitoxin system RelE/ParE family toxin n=1 Tax=Lunatimonas sp. TaxID=2060141 RepID=UPI00263A6C41|nr:type II toxin-antitoxin system RelE/ParE family toxin [Lunatimonas sp.]MCC5939885.1 type II toxin-antitoxin system RelE/ParE family toxin [Lunatimonas sp.]
MANYVLSVKADEDVDAIADYSLEKWGEKQTLVYIEELFNCLEKIASSPEIGRDASEFFTHLKRNNYKAHSIFYLRSESNIIIVRILGQQQDFHRHL